MSAHKTHFTADWFTGNAEGWLRLLGYMRDKPIQALEIGSYEGRSAHWILTNLLTHEHSHLTCVDTWDDTDLSLTGLTVAAESRFDFNMGPFLSKLSKVKAYSHTAIAHMTVALARFDLIFIDGDHEGEGALTDLVMCWPLLKRDGWLAFDDYQWTGANLRSQPRDAFDAWRSIKPAGLAEVIPVGRLMFARKDK